MTSIINRKLWYDTKKSKIETKLKYSKNKSNLIQYLKEKLYLLIKKIKMKKLITAFMMIASTLNLSAQNGGMSNENAALKIEYSGMNNGMTVVKVTNKDTCTADMRVQWAQHIRNKDVAALSSDTFQLPTQPSCFIMATSSSPCRNVYYGQVELNYCQALPITFEYIYVKQISDRIVNIQFKVAEADGTDRFNIQLSKDGVNFKTVSVVLPDAIQTNRIYNVNIKL